MMDGNGRYKFKKFVIATRAEINYRRYLGRLQRQREKKDKKEEARAKHAEQVSLPRKIERSERANSIAMKRIAQVAYYPSRLGVKMLATIAKNEALSKETRAEAGKLLLEIAIEGKAKRTKLNKPVK